MKVSFDDEESNKEVPSEAGWYYFCTNAPYSAFSALPPPPLKYANAGGEIKKYRNYNLSARANSHSNENGKSSIVIIGSDKYAVSGFDRRQEATRHRICPKTGRSWVRHHDGGLYERPARESGEAPQVGAVSGENIRHKAGSKMNLTF